MMVLESVTFDGPLVGEDEVEDFIAKPTSGSPTKSIIFSICFSLHVSMSSMYEERVVLSGMSHSAWFQIWEDSLVSISGEIRTILLPCPKAIVEEIFFIQHLLLVVGSNSTQLLHKITPANKLPGDALLCLIGRQTSRLPNKIGMEEEILSVISNGGTNVTAEASDSNSSSNPFHGSKRSKQGTNVSSGRFKGVVPQQNGHWGAQIYANHQRIWLGTYKSETQAAMAYDSAAIKLRSGDNHRNFPWTNLTIQEPGFQNLFSTETVVSMIKDGSYPSKFAEFLKTESHRGETEVTGLDQAGVGGNGRLMCRLLFQKELTPSDVGKLNRLVIPKKYALKHFPPISESGKENEDGDIADDMQLFFYDRVMRLWKFRYCYWRSSQSFVFTRGWNRFVKEKELNANDVITFYMCEYERGTKVGRTFCMIDVAYERNTDSRSFVEGPKDERKSEEEESVAAAAPKGDKKGFRLFGVQIG